MSLPELPAREPAEPRAVVLVYVSELGLAIRVELAASREELGS
jgi:hypothetical protein